MKNLLFNNRLLNITKGIVFLWLYFPILSIGQTNAVYSFSDYYGSLNMVSSYDGGYLIAPQSTTGNTERHILKINKQGGIEWKIKPNIDDRIHIFKIAPLSNGDIIATGETYKYWSPFLQENGDEVDGVLLRINTCGEVEWIKTYRRHTNINVLEALRYFDIDSFDNIWVNAYVSYANQEERDSVVDGKLGSRSIMNKYNADGDLLETTDNIFEHNAYILNNDNTSDGGTVAVSYCGLLPYYNQVFDADSNFLAIHRSVVLKYDEFGEIEWWDAYRWEEDQVYSLDSIPMMTNDKVVSSRGAQVLQTDSNTYLVSASQYLFSEYHSSRYTKFLLYELDANGNMLRDSVFDYHRNAALLSFDVLDDTTLVFECTSFPFDDFSIDSDSHLEIWKIDSRTWEIKSRFIDSSTVNYLGSSIAVTSDKKILLTSYQQNSLGAQLRVVNSETMAFDTVPAIDTTNYDYLCSGIFTPELLTLPADTNVYEPIGFVENKPMEIDLFVENKILHFTGLKPGNYSYTIVNSLGQVVDVGDLSSSVTTKDVSFLSRGSYHITMASKQGLNTCYEKFIVQ